jgi:hypothetical protein
MMNSEPTDSESFRVVSKAMAAIRARYPDYDSFQDEILRLTQCFRMGDVSADAYIEGLYLIAKFAWHSQAAARCPDEAWMIANRKSEPANKPSGLQ